MNKTINKNKTKNNFAWSLLALGLIAAGSDNAAAATTWTNALANGNINAAGNWSNGLPTIAAANGAQVFTTALVINQVFNNGTDNKAAFLITGTGGMTVATGGLFTFSGDGLIGTGAFGNSTITHTGGALIQDAAGAGFLIGHTKVGTYNISGGLLNVTGTSASLTIAFLAGSSGSSLNVSGNGLVDIASGRNLVINNGGTLNVTDGGLLIWRNRTLAETNSFGGTVNALKTQVGNDVYFTAVPEPSSIALLGLGGLALILRRRR